MVNMLPWLLSEGAVAPQVPKEPRVALPGILLQPHALVREMKLWMVVLTMILVPSGWVRKASPPPTEAGMEASAPRYHLLVLLGALTCREPHISEKKPGNPGHWSSSLKSMMLGGVTSRGRAGCDGQLDLSPIARPGMYNG